MEHSLMRLRNWGSCVWLVPLVLGLLTVPVVTFGADSEAKDKARALYAEGIRAQQADQYNRARIAFTEALALHNHYKIAANLGAVELKLGKRVEAVGHLRGALAQIKADSDADPAKVSEIQALLDEAKGQLLKLEVTTEFQGARLSGVQLFVDGRLIPGSRSGKKTLYLEPKRRVLQARVAGASSIKYQLSGEVGKTEQLALQLYANGPGSPYSSGDSRTSAAIAVAERPLWPAFVGGGVAVGAGALAAVAVYSADHASNTAAASTGLVEQQAAESVVLACSQPGTDIATNCDAWRKARLHRRNWTSVAVGSFVTLGSSLIATTVYLLWPHREAPSVALHTGVGDGVSWAALSGRF